MPKLPSSDAVVQGVIVTVVALGVWELWGRDLAMKLKDSLS